jgi:hypothetical protein
MPPQPTPQLERTADALSRKLTKLQGTDKGLQGVALDPFTIVSILVSLFVRLYCLRGPKSLARIRRPSGWDRARLRLALVREVGLGPSRAYFRALVEHGQGLSSSEWCELQRDLEATAARGALDART